MTIKLILYIITVPLSIFALDSININGIFKVNRIFQARLLYLMLSLCLSYLFTCFLYDFAINSVIIKQYVVYIGVINIKKILLFSFTILIIPYLIVSIFISNDEIIFNYNSYYVVRVFRKKLNKVDRVPIEEYIVGVLSGEMPVNFELEALKAQAVASRSYVMYQIQKNKSKEYDVVDDVNNQVYLDISLQKEKWGDDYVINSNKIKEAVLDTAGEYLEYDGNIVEAMFFSTSSGMTENSEDVFSNVVPYLRSVSSNWDEISPVYSDCKKFSKSEFYNLINIDYKNDLQVIINKTSSTGRILEITINGHRFTGKEICAKLQLKSTFFSILEDGDDIIINTKGYGHGVGMSQYGAEGMAKDGYKYDEILKHYYSGVEIKKN